MADHGVDHVHEAYGPPVALSFSRAASNILGLWAVLQGMPMTVAPARAQFRHDVPYGLAGIVRRLAEQEGRALPIRSGKE